MTVLPHKLAAALSLAFAKICDFELLLISKMLVFLLL